MNNLIQRFVAPWIRPMGAMQDVKNEPADASIKSAMLFIVVVGLLSGLITAAMGMILPPPVVSTGQIPKSMLWLTVPLLPIFYFIGSFFSAFIVWAIFGGILKGSSQDYKTIYRLMAVPVAFYPASALLSPIPKVGQYLAIAVNVWAIVVMVRGVILVLDTKPVRTWVTFGVMFGMLILLALVARSGAQNQLGAGGFPNLEGNLGDFGDDDIDFNATDEELDKQLKTLAEQEKKNTNTKK